MYLSGLLVRNFRSLENVEVKFGPGLNVLVGKNNAGKSNIIEALDYVLGEKWPTSRQIQERTFYRVESQKSPSDSFLICVKLEGGQLSRDEISRLSARKTKTYRVQEYPPFREPEHLPDWFEQAEQQRYAYPTYTDLASDLDQASYIFLFLFVPRGVPNSEYRFGLCYSGLTGKCYVPTLNKEIRDLLLTTAYVPAFRDPRYQLRVTEYSWYGKLIRHLYDQQNTEQQERIDSAQQTLSDVLREIFSDATNEIRQQLARAVFHHEITFRPGAFTSDDNYKQITLFVDDGLNAPFYDKGSGIQSALILALFTHYCRAFHRGSSLLMVEEPEIYLHPQARRALEAQLVSFVQDSRFINNGSNQVIIATHSPEFLRSVSVEELCLVYKIPGKNPTLVKQVSDDSLRASQIIETKNAEMFFADHVILVEGGEEYLLPVLADLFNSEKRWLDVSNISIARVNGKGQFAAYTSLLESFDIKWSILADLDFLKDGIASYSDYLNDYGKQCLGHIRGVWDTLGELPTGHKIKNKVFDKNTRDWTKLYLATAEAIEDITSGEDMTDDRVDEIKMLWASLQDRVYKANFERLVRECSVEIGEVLRQLAQKGIFVLSRGELEDYLTDEALNLSHSKDLRAMKVAQKLSELSSTEECSSWLDYQEFAILLKHVARTIGTTANSFD